MTRVRFRELRGLQQHDRLHVHDLARGDQADRFVQCHLEHFDILAFIRLAATGRAWRCGIIVRQEAGAPLLYRARTDEAIGHQPGIADGDAGFFHRFPDNADFRRVAIQLAGNGLDQRPAVTGFEHRPAELADQHHAAAGAVQRQHHGGVADVIALPHLMLPDAVAALEVETRPPQRVVIVGEGF